ncbi:extracellular solute-binding protein [Chloroflexi bacterium TSY]|nr:extracellular solute-binding protein [Chloroflexi bacterium TSY]
MRAPAPSSDGAVEDGEKTPLRITHWWGANFDDSINLFADNRPEYEISNEPAPWDGYADKLPTTIAAGTAPDAFFLDAGFFGSLLPQGISVDLTSYLEADAEIDPNKWAIDPGLDTGVDGVPFGLPQWHPDSADIVVNKDLFAEAGISVPEFGTDEFMTWNWNTFLEAAKELTKQESEGNYEQWGLGGLGRGVWSPQRDMVWTNGGEFYDDVTHSNPTVARFTDPEFIEAWQWLVDLELVHGVATRPDDEGLLSTEGPYLSGKVAMTWMWNIYGTMKKANFEWGVITPPFEGRRANKYGGNGWCVSSASDVKDAAYDYISWATTRLEGQVAFTKVGTIPVYDPASVLPEAESEAQGKVWNLIIARQDAAIEDGAARPFSLGPQGNQITDILQAENDLIYNGDKTVEEAMTSAKEQTDSLLAA